MDVSGTNTANLDRKIDALVRWLERAARKQNIVNYYLLAASVIGTIAWGFGDWLARRYIS